MVFSQIKNIGSLCNEAKFNVSLTIPSSMPPSPIMAIVISFLLFFFCAKDVPKAIENLHDYIVNNPISTFCIRVTGDSMINIGIFSGDILIIDRSINPRNNHIILAVLDGEFLLKRLNFQEGNVVLKAENEYYQPIFVYRKRDFKVWGVVIASLI